MDRIPVLLVAAGQKNVDSKSGSEVKGYTHISSTKGVFLWWPRAAMVFFPSTNFFAACKQRPGCYQIPLFTKRVIRRKQTPARTSSSRYLDNTIQGDSVYSLQNRVRLLVRSGGQSLSTDLLQRDPAIFHQHQVLGFHLVPTRRRNQQVSSKISGASPPLRSTHFALVKSASDKLPPATPLT